MSLAPRRQSLQLPDSLRTQLFAFRRKVWMAKIAEALFLAAFVVAAVYLVLFGLDRVWESPTAARLGLFAVVLLGVCAVPLALYRWVFQVRRLDQIARLLGREMPNLGDQLLGVIELEHNSAEQQRSPELVEAAIHQVAGDSAKQDLNEALPHPRHRLWAALAAVPLA